MYEDPKYKAGSNGAHEGCGGSPRLPAWICHGSGLIVQKSACWHQEWVQYMMCIASQMVYKGTMLLGAICALQLCQELTLRIAGHRCTKVRPHARRERRDQASCKKYSIEKCWHPLKCIKKDWTYWTTCHVPMISSFTADRRMSYRGVIPLAWLSNRIYLHTRTSRGMRAPGWYTSNKRRA